MSNEEWNPLRFRLGIDSKSAPSADGGLPEWQTLQVAIGQALLKCMEPLVIGLNRVLEKLAK